MLNPQQQAVVDHDAGPVLVLAGAGTGKTRVLVDRTVRLLESGLPPQRLLLITFTRKSAQELKERVQIATGGMAYLPWCGTFHGVAVRMLRLYGAWIGIPSNFSIFDEADSTSLMGAIVNETYSVEQRKTLPRKSTLGKIHSYWRNTRQDLGDVLAERWPAHLKTADAIQGIFDRYGKRKSAGNALDYDDLLIHWLKLLQAKGSPCGDLFDYVMVDEYQDTNRLQADILREVGKATGNIMVVGDDAQAIYAFRGATVANILEFEQEFAGAVRLRLEKNYRSTQEILDAANTLLSHAEEGFPKKLVSHKGAGKHPHLDVAQDEWGQAEAILGSIARHWQENHVPLREQAVLFRSAFHSFKLETLLQRHGIPYKKYGGIRFADSAHIKDAISFLRCRENPCDESAWRRILEMLPGVGAATAGRLFAKLCRDLSPAATLEAAKFPKKCQEWVEPFRSVIRTLFAKEEPPLDLQLKAVVKFCRACLSERYEDAEKRAPSLKLLEQLTATYQSRRQLLDDMVVGDDSILGQVDPAAEGEFLTLSTIHSAKGCEWDCVHVIQLIEGGLPVGVDDEEVSRVEEERRLLYVAMTRARRDLHLYYPCRRDSYDGGFRTTTPCQASRFLTPDVRECCNLPDGGPEADLDEIIYDYDGDPDW